MSEKFVDAIEPLLLFPTVVRQFQTHGFEKENDELLAKILEKEARSRPTYSTDARNWQTDDFLHREPEFQWIADMGVKLGKEYIKFMQYEYDDLVMHEMWANVYRREEDLHQHNHPNSFLSGVYYMTDENSEIEFADPRTDIRSVFMPGQINNFFNAFTFPIKPQKGMFVFFPSWLKHLVVPQSAGFRVSIAFNLMLEGKIGSRLDKTSAELPPREGAYKPERNFEDDLL